MASSVPRISVDSFSTASPLSSTSYAGEHQFSRPGSSGRPGSSSRNHLRRSSTASSIHSVGGSLDTAPVSQRIYESGQNAISSLLLPPIVRTGLLPHATAPASSAHKPPTARDIPPVNLSSVRHVEASAFAPYLAQVGALYDALQRTKGDQEEGEAQLPRRGKKEDDFATIFGEDRRPLTRPSFSRQGSLASLASIDLPSPRRRTSRSRQAAQAPTPLSTIPNVYFEEDFHLENPRTFDVVSERSEVVRPIVVPDAKSSSDGHATSPRKALATNAILQEKLSWYLDTVEIHLVSSISSASTSFFATLGSLRELHSETADSVNRIRTLRKDLEMLDTDMVVAGLQMVKKKRRRENLKQLSRAVIQLSRINEAVHHCEAMVDGGEVDKALNAITSLEKLMSGEEPDPSIKATGGMSIRDLRGITALLGVTKNLETLRYRTGKIYESRLLDLLLGDLKEHVAAVSTSQTLQRWSSNSQRSRGVQHREPAVLPAYMTMRPELRPDLLSILTGLDRARHTVSATAAYRDAVLREIRTIMRKYMPSSNEDDADTVMSSSTVGAGKPKDQKSTILARNLRSLDPEDAEQLLKNTYVAVAETMRRLGTQVKVLLDVTSMLGEPLAATASIKSPPRSPHTGALEGRASQASLSVQEEMHQILDTTNLLGQAVDIAQDKITRILKVRSDQSIQLSMEIFIRYFTLNFLFANECEAVSGRGGTTLKSVVNTQIRDFVREMGERERQTLAKGMQADPWNAKDFAEEDKEHLDRILLASTQNVEAWSTGTKIWLAFPTSIPRTSLLTNGANLNPVNGAGTGSNTGTSTPTTTPRPTIRPASIPPQSFLLPFSAMLCLQGLSHFLHLATCIPFLVTEISTNIISYLTLFNSRCTQLILGAGATRSAANLKNITTKHLALALQALNFVGVLITNVREAIRRVAPSNVSVSQVMGEFERCRRMVSEHEEQIQEKFGDIMRGRGAAHVKSMRGLDWRNMAGEKGVNMYMETLCKETMTLQKVLSKHLPKETVVGIMRPIFEGYRDMWGKAFGEVDVGRVEGYARMLQDVEYFQSRLGSLEGAGQIADHIVSIVKAKEPPTIIPSSPPNAASLAQNPSDHASNNIVSRYSGEAEDAYTRNGVNDLNMDGPSQTEENGGGRGSEEVGEKG